MLLATTATMVAGVMLPHLSRDWETGRRRSVSDQTNLIIKLLALALMAIAVAMLLAGPLVFDVLLRGKFSGGLGVLPMMLACCVWMALFAPAYNFVWCAERAGLGSLVILVGLLVSIGLSMWLVPIMELPGAVLATTAANLLVLLLILALCGGLGLRMDRGVWACLALPLLLCLDPWGALVGWVAAAWLACRTNWLFHPAEKRRIQAFLGKALARIAPHRGLAGETLHR
jgi:PST family polysaccharide transporter